MKHIYTAILTLALSANVFAANLTEVEHIGVKADGNVREYPFKPTALSVQVGGRKIESPVATKSFKEALPSILVPAGVISIEGKFGILLGDRFYFAGDVLRVELSDSARDYDSPAESVLLNAISDKEITAAILPNTDALIAISIPQPKKMETAQASAKVGNGVITFLRHQTPVKARPKASAKPIQPAPTKIKPQPAQAKVKSQPTGAAPKFTKPPVKPRPLPRKLNAQQKKNPR